MVMILLINSHLDKACVPFASSSSKTNFCHVKRILVLLVYTYLLVTCGLGDQVICCKSPFA